MREVKVNFELLLMREFAFSQIKFKADCKAKIRFYLNMIFSVKKKMFIEKY